MNKEIIFFDADGTLWYPRSTKRSNKPHWVYEKNKEPKDYLHLLTLTPSLVNILTKLKRRRIILVAISTHPHSLKEATIHMSSKIKHFNLESLFYSVLTSRPYPSGKGHAIVRYLKKLKIPKSKALLIGDSYLYDYKSAKNAGIDCLLIRTPYMNSKGDRIKTISHLREILN